jgi:hypothetical protein
MLCRIKDIPIGFEFENMQFLREMKINGVHKFYPYDEQDHMFDNWYRMCPDLTGGCAYHISWLEQVE